MVGAGRVEEQPKRFKGVSADDDGSGTLEMFETVDVVVDDSVGAIILSHRNASDHTVIPNLRAVRNCVGNMGDERRCLRSYLAALDTEAAVDTVWSVSVRRREDGNRATRGDTDAKCGAAPDEDVAHLTHRVGAVGVAVRLNPTDNTPVQQRASLVPAVGSRAQCVRSG